MYWFPDLLPRPLSRAGEVAPPLLVVRLGGQTGGVLHPPVQFQPVQFCGVPLPGPDIAPPAQPALLRPAALPTTPCLAFPRPPYLLFPARPRPALPYSAPARPGPG